MRYLTIFLLLLVLVAGFYVLAPGPSAQALIRAGRLVAGLQTHTVRVQGLEISYLQGGSGRVLLMIHGFGADKDNWQRFAGFFTKHYLVIAPDLPGFGDSSNPADMRFDVESQAARLAAFADALGLAQMHVVGNSMGGQIAAVLAVRRPDLVASLALFDPLGVEQEPGVQPSTTMRRLAAGENMLLPRDRPAFDSMIGLMFYKVPWVPGALASHYATHWIRRMELHTRVFSDITGRYVPLMPLLPQLHVPTLVLWGADDEILPAGGARVLAQGLANGTQVVIPECGHLPMLEKPRETAAHYRAFLDALTAP